MFIIFFLFLTLLELCIYTLFNNIVGSWVYNLKMNFKDDKLTTFGFLLLLNLALSFALLCLYKVIIFVKFLNQF